MNVDYCLSLPWKKRIDANIKILLMHKTHAKYTSVHRSPQTVSTSTFTTGVLLCLVRVVALIDCALDFSFQRLLFAKANTKQWACLYVFRLFFFCIHFVHFDAKNRTKWKINANKNIANGLNTYFTYFIWIAFLLRSLIFVATK